MRGQTDTLGPRGVREAPELPAHLEVLEQASAGDVAAVDLLDVQVAWAQQPGHQYAQVVGELRVNLCGGGEG